MSNAPDGRRTAGRRIATCTLRLAESKRRDALLSHVLPLSPRLGELG